MTLTRILTLTVTVTLTLTLTLNLNLTLTLTLTPTLTPTLSLSLTCRARCRPARRGGAARAGPGRPWRGCAGAAGCRRSAGGGKAGRVG